MILPMRSCIRMLVVRFLSSSFRLLISRDEVALVLFHLSSWAETEVQLWATLVVAVGLEVGSLLVLRS